MPAKRSDDAKTVDAHIGARLRALRELRGLSQGALAERLGLKSRQAVASYEAGDPIAASALFRLTQVLQVDAHAFFDGLPAGRAQLAEDCPRLPSAKAAQLAALLARTPPAHHATILKVVRTLADGLGAAEEE